MRFTVAVLTMALLGCMHAAAQEPKEEQVTITLTKDLKVTEFLDGAALTVGRPILYDPNGQRFQMNQVMGTDMRWSVPKGRELDLIRSILAFYEITLVSVGPQGHAIFLAIDSRSTNNLVKNKAEFVPYESLGEYADKDGLFIATSMPVSHVEGLSFALPLYLYLTARSAPATTGAATA